jgi:hypothetical protein
MPRQVSIPNTASVSILSRAREGRVRLTTLQAVIVSALRLQGRRAVLRVTTMTACLTEVYKYACAHKRIHIQRVVAGNA